MTPVRRRPALAAATTMAVWAVPSAASAHGVAIRGDLPLPLWATSYGAVGILILVYLGLRRWSSQPTRATTATRLPDGTTRVVGLLEWPLRVVGLAVLGVTLAAALVGSDIATRNPAPYVLFVVVWVLLSFVQPVIGDVWRWLNPFETIAIGLDRLDLVGPDDVRVDRWGHWPAVATTASFFWLQLVWVDPSDPRAVGVWLALYVAAVALPGAFLGGAWVRAADGIGVFLSLLAAIAPFDRDAEGRIALRLPFVGLSQVRLRPGTAALIVLVLGGTTFDGVTRTDLWSDSVMGRAQGNLRMVYGTLGLAVTVTIVMGLYRYAIADAAVATDQDRDELADAFVHTLVPVVLGYQIAHYFSVLLFEGQRTIALASDPFYTGANVFGTAGQSIDFGIVSTTTIGWVQVLGILLGSTASLVLAHRRAVARFGPDERGRAEQGMLVALVAYTVAGLLILLGA